MVQNSDGLALTNQVYSVPSTSGFSYKLKAILVPDCGYSTTAWTATTTSTNNPASTSNYDNINAAGLFSAGPFSDSTTAGTYYITISSITLNVFGVDTVINSIATTPSNSFALFVSDGCADAVITATAQSGIFSTVYTLG